MFCGSGVARQNCMLRVEKRGEEKGYWTAPTMFNAFKKVQLQFHTLVRSRVILKEVGESGEPNRGERMTIGVGTGRYGRRSDHYDWLNRRCSDRS